MNVLAAILRWTTSALLFGATLGAAVAAAAPSWVPAPPDSLVTDRAGVLSPAGRDALARRLTRYEAQSGHQLVVWIDRSSKAVPIEQFAVEAFAAWKIGRAGLDDGLAIFAMTQDRTLRIEVGYELESSVTDLVAASVIRNTMIPLIQGDQWDAAIEQGVESLVNTIEGQAGSLPAAQRSDRDESRLDLWHKLGLGLFAVGFVIVLILLINRPRRALELLIFLGRSGMLGVLAGRGKGGGGKFRGGGGRSGGGGATGHW